MPAIYTGATKLKISFENNDMTWKYSFIDVFQVQDTTPITWLANNTFLYESNTTYRSGTINHNSSSSFTLTVMLTSPGSISFNYSGQSETNRDLFRVLIDNTQVLQVSGTYPWTVFTRQLEIGTHSIQFTYLKDTSFSSGLDAFALGYIELEGVRPQFDNWYLIKNNSNSKFYTEVDGLLNEVTIEGPQPTLEEFRTLGTKTTPNATTLTTIAKYTLLKCIDTPNLQEYGTLLNINTYGNMRPTLMKVTPPATIVEDYQTGFNKIEASVTHTATTDMRFIISYDNLTWHTFNGSTWIITDYIEEDVLTNGMSETTLNGLSASDFLLLYTETVPLVMYIAFVVKATAADDWSINSLRISFTTNL